jgi:uncharacterized LabA/DUF88 family protein
MNNYLFIDGSALLQQIKYLQHQRSEFAGKKLNVHKFIRNFLKGIFSDVHRGEIKRVVFYFVKNEERIDNYLIVRDPAVPGPPGLVLDVAFKECGRQLKLSKAQKDFLDNATEEIRELCTKREKGVDIQICADALKLSATSNMDRLFLLTNDSDFVPLCEALKDLGTNVSLFHLSQVNQLNKELRQACDNYGVLIDNELEHAFDPTPFA